MVKKKKEIQDIAERIAQIDNSQELKNSKWKVTVRKLFSYKRIEVCIRQFHGTTVRKARTFGDYFEYMFFWEGRFYTSYMSFVPEKGKRRLTENQTRNAVGMIITGATTTIDELIKDREAFGRLGKLMEPVRAA